MTWGTNAASGLKEALINSRMLLALGRIQHQGEFVKAGWLPVEQTQCRGWVRPKAPPGKA